MGKTIAVRLFKRSKEQCLFMYFSLIRKTY